MGSQCQINYGCSWGMGNSGTRQFHGESDPKKKKQALAFLFQAIAEDMVLQMADYTDPKQVWDGLKTR